MSGKTRKNEILSSENTTTYLRAIPNVYYLLSEISRILKEIWDRQSLLVGVESINFWELLRESRATGNTHTYLAQLHYYRFCMQEFFV